MLIRKAVPVPVSEYLSHYFKGSKLVVWSGANGVLDYLNYWSLRLPCGYYNENWAMLTQHLWEHEKISIDSEEIQAIVARKYHEVYPDMILRGE